MNDNDWPVADAIARELARRDCDPNEVAKAFVYLRTCKDPERFFRFLDTLAQRGQALVRSRQTLDYYKAVSEVCKQYLSPYRSEPARMCQVLGWAVRLMRYHMTQRPAAPRGARGGQRPPFRGGRR